MRYIFLNQKFYNQFDEKNYPEIERKLERPYVMLTVNINGVVFGIPLRSGINHPNALWTNKQNHCGADYSKAVLIPDDSYIDSRNPYIRPEEHRVLIQKEHQLKIGFDKYINEYKKALKDIHIDRNKLICKYSTLQYYHKELNIT
ncbi:type III toxin-antitoxin system TenpIN family toxin [Acetivibrio cellulolyticus]|uniref:type III toxin-antitoxin system TenpIN family toxin n=1 Tax=Acetivibrio cellulolyticus TaxID=35830 RepID=UPI0001E2C7AD|nr:hypothetical protein [Acetivibrio cellulolyticus]